LYRYRKYCTCTDHAAHSRAPPCHGKRQEKKIKHRLDVSLQGLLSPDAHGMIAQKRSCEAVLWGFYASITWRNQARSSAMHVLKHWSLYFFKALSLCLPFEHLRKLTPMDIHAFVYRDGYGYSLVKFFPTQTPLEHKTRSCMDFLY